MRASTDDPRIRLLNRLYAKRRKELHERKTLRDAGDAEPQAVRAFYMQVQTPHLTLHVVPAGG